METQQEVEIEAYSYGGCQTCGHSWFNWMRRNHIAVKHTNVQIPYEYRNAVERARALGYNERTVRFPMFFLGDRVFVGFQPTEILEAVNQLRGSHD